MLFTPWQTDHDEYKHSTGDRKMPIEVFTKERGQDRTVIELEWHQARRPYYNVHPALVSKLCEVNLDAIPSDLMEIPDNLPVVNIRLADNHPDFAFREDMFCEGNDWEQGHFAKGSAVTSILMSAAYNNAGSVKGYSFLLNGSTPTSDGRSSILVLFALKAEGLTVEEVFAQTIRMYKKTSPDSRRILRNVLRLCVTVGFLRNGDDELITPDVLSKDRQRHATGNEHDRQTIEDRARRRGKLGWNVGNDAMFLPDSPAPGGHTPISKGGELSHAHLRKGHFHAVRFGPGRSKVKLMWFRPTTVRPDKPFKVSS